MGYVPTLLPAAGGIPQLTRTHGRRAYAVQQTGRGIGAPANPLTSSNYQPPHPQTEAQLKALTSHQDEQIVPPIAASASWTLQAAAARLHDPEQSAGNLQPQPEKP